MCRWLTACIRGDADSGKPPSIVLITGTPVAAPPPGILFNGNICNAATYDGRFEDGLDSAFVVVRASAPFSERIFNIEMITSNRSQAREHARSLKNGTGDVWYLSCPIDRSVQTM